MEITKHEEYFFCVKAYLNSYLLPIEMSNLVKQVYHGSVIKPVIAAHQKQTVDFSFIFYINRPFFKPLWIEFFSSYLMLRILLNFHQLQYYEKCQYAKTHDQVFINSIHNAGNPGRLNRIFHYLLDWLLQVISRQLQVFLHLSSHFNLS